MAALAVQALARALAALMAPHTLEFTSVAWVVRPLPPLMEASRLTKEAAAARSRRLMA